ncbi:permease [Flavobacterium akiainvivens]|uniref:Permease n=1 Tax=Flavobacterium akiainvivens TaxID=1202724 RepID=A0A0M8M9M8_9FLAO|nr:FtsX-like permease family protein [Flavobacterium akiainvivens]KOS06443.1 permease [Flavobacterium akiainvivens]SFQ13436.1 putative ABC transport system permease protein [Flavobacterium akiainvivens]
MITKIAWKNIWFKPLNTVLSIILLTSSVAIITLLILLENQFERKFNDNIDGIDLVLGAQGSPLQLILSSVYQVDAPTGNIDYAEAKTWMKNPLVKKAIPLAFGDNYRGFKIVGTTPDYLTHYGAKMQQGKVFSKNFEVVVGSTVAQKMGLKLGDTFFGSHGDSSEGEVHEDHAYIVTGIAAETGKVADNVILCNIPSVWAMHEGHDHNHEGEESHDHEDHDHDHEAHAGEEAHNHEEYDHDHDAHAGEEAHNHEEHDHDHETVISEEGKEITAVILKMRNPMSVLVWQNMIPMNTKMQAASPGREINRLFSLFGIGLDALQYLAYGIMLISGISIFIALYNTLKERKYEFALLRVNGASRLQLLMLVLIESLLLCITGFIFGTVVGRIALSLISGSSETEFKISFNPLEFVWEKEGYLLGLTIFVGILAAVIPAVKAYSLNISKTLANA